MTGNFKRGDLVYIPFEGGNVSGKIVNVDPSEPDAYTIKTSTGDTIKDNGYGVKLLDKMIIAAQKKLDKLNKLREEVA